MWVLGCGLFLQVQHFCSIWRYKIEKRLTKCPKTNTRLIKPCLTKRAPGKWESARFRSIFPASSFFYISNIIHARPLAGKASRYFFNSLRDCATSFRRRAIYFPKKDLALYVLSIRFSLQNWDFLVYAS